MKRLLKKDVFFRRSAVSLIRCQVSNRDDDFDEIALSIVESPPADIYKTLVALTEAAAVWSGYIADSLDVDREQFIKDWEEFIQGNSKG